MIYTDKQIQYHIRKSIEIIKRGLVKAKSPYIACSWGKDSIVMLWLIRKVNKDIPVVFKNSNYCFPDTYQIRDELIEKWEIDNYIELPPAMDYKDVVDQFGLPDITRKSKDQSKVVQMLKKDKRDELQDFDSVFLGIRQTESNARKNMIRYNGPIQELKNGLIKIMPIAYWDFDLLWQVIEKFKIPMNGIYYKDKFGSPEWIRNSGILSTDGASMGKISWIKYYYPAIYRRLALEYPEVKRYV